MPRTESLNYQFSIGIIDVENYSLSERATSLSKMLGLLLMKCMLSVSQLWSRYMHIHRVRVLSSVYTCSVRIAMSVDGLY